MAEPGKPEPWARMDANGTATQVAAPLCLGTRYRESGIRQDNGVSGTSEVQEPSVYC